MRRKGASPKALLSIVSDGKTGGGSHENVHSHPLRVPHRTVYRWTEYSSSGDGPDGCILTLPL